MPKERRPVKAEKPRPRSPGVVCLGASAGGLVSLKVILNALPADFPWPVLILQHFPADVQSRLPEILGRTSALTVREAAEGESLEPGVALTSPSGAEMGVTPDARTVFRPRKRGPPNSVDHLFATASLAAGPAMVAVVLSGVGSDGTAGSRVVKKNGGTVIVEHPETAEWPGMPAAAIRAGVVDKVLSSQDIAPALVRLTVSRVPQPSR